MAFGEPGPTTERHPYGMYYTKIVDIIPELNNKQLDRLSEFLSNFSLLIMATLVLPNIFGVTKSNTNDLMSGVALTILLLSLSIIIIRKK